MKLRGIKRAAMLVAGVALLVAIVALRQPAAEVIVAMAGWVEGLGWIAPVAFTVVFALAVPAFLPAAPFLLASGVLFGPILGSVYGAIGNSLGGALAFLLARYLARERVQAALESRLGFEAFNRALGQEGVRGVALIRLSPALPAWLINYALGVSRVDWKQYWLSAPAILPVTVLYALGGAGLGDLAALEGGGGPDRGAGYYALLGGGIVGTIVVSVLLGRRARRIMEDMDDEDG